MMKERFPGWHYRPPASAEAIARAQAALGVALPAELRALYLEADGFRENVGNAKYLLSLFDEDFIGSLVSVTRYHWEHTPGIDLRPYVFFGSSSSDAVWGLPWREPGGIIAFHHGGFEVAGTGILEVYRRDFASYVARHLPTPPTP